MAESETKASAVGLPLFAVTIFWGAFLLFLVQPLIGKYILPWFGGTPGVWTTCLLFFQCLLLGGYAYAHCLNHFFPLRKQVIIHGVLLALAVITLPITPSESLKPVGGESPTLQILLLLALSIGLPYLVLSATGPLVQAWFARTHPGRSPYRLYALSNVGSLLALVGYPFLVEPWSSRTSQVNGWSWGMLFYGAACGWLAWRLYRAKDVGKVELEESTEESPLSKAMRWLLWLALPACGTALLMATTNKLCLDVAVVPFLWVLPLALYLITFIICFDNPRWYVREYFVPLLVPLWVGVIWALKEGVDMGILTQVGLLCGALFVSCMVCHGELYRLRPEPARLTQYFLGISGGGALGGLFVAVLAPLWFDGYWEFHISLWTVGLLFFVACCVRREDWRVTKWHLRLILLGCWLTVCLALLKDSSLNGKWRALSVMVPFVVACLLTRLVYQQWWGPLRRTESRELYAGIIGAFGALTLTLVALVIAGDSLVNSKFHYLNQFHPGIWVVTALLALNAFVWNSVRTWRGWRIQWGWAAGGWVPVLVALAVGLIIQARDGRGDAIYRERGFYGILKISEFSLGDDEFRLLLNGRITHGYQFTGTEASKRVTTYYGPPTGVGIAVQHFPIDANSTQGLRVGVVGLGVGTLAGYAEQGDYYRMYEINPQVVKLSALEVGTFTYLLQAKDRGAEVEVVLGDARLSMEAELRAGKPQGFHVLALDAFSSDSIPVHLLTREAVAIYLKHLDPKGVLAVHISNRYLDLEPVVRRLAREFGLTMMVVNNLDGGIDEEWVYGSAWVLLGRDPEFFETAALFGYPFADLTEDEDSPLWSDDYASIFRIMYKPDWWYRWGDRWKRLTGQAQ
ncbi:MAG: hypothetical protein H8E27_04165 [Verrucomicrobia subdivision 3 bacterium]|nr:hypothetical protein [Limisphaerales bacterium]